MTSPSDVFHSEAYIAHNEARLLHVARLLGSMGIEASGKTVLEVGAGIGDHTQFWVDRGAVVTATDARSENVSLIQSRFPDTTSFVLDLDTPTGADVAEHEIVYAFGLLYHLKDPSGALAFLSQKCTDYLLLETCVSYGDSLDINVVEEPAENPSQAASGFGCRPTRPWVFEELKSHFPYVYQPSYQPDHPQFPVDWGPDAEKAQQLSRTTFIASRHPITASSFFPRVLDRQTRQSKRDVTVKPGLDGVLSRVGFGLVLDVGANQGQFVARLRALGYSGPIACFEPMNEAFQRLTTIADHDAQLTLFNFALGAKKDARDIFLSGNSASSSFLPIEDMTVEAEPMTSVVGKERVQIQRLDDIADDLFSKHRSGPVLLKLDVQGYERDVLEGAAASLDEVDYVLAECSLVSVYKGERLVEEQIAWLRQRGFVPVSMDLGWSDPSSGETYQTDILFKRQ